ncbi:MAG: flagellar protein FlaG [Terriglobales bacterium]
MTLNPSLSSPPPAIADVAPARAKNTRPRSADPSTLAFRPPAPVLVSAPAADDVRLQWDKDNGVVIKFTDRKSGGVTRQIPSEQMLSIAKFIRHLLQQQETASASSGKGASGRNPWQA